MRRAPGFIRANSRAPMRPRLASTSGTWMVTKSDLCRRSSSCTSCTLNSSARSTETTGLLARLKHRGGHLRLAAHDERLEVADPLDELPLRKLGGDDYLAFAAQAAEAVLGQRVGDQNPRHGTSLGGDALQGIR